MNVLGNQKLPGFYQITMPVLFPQNTPDNRVISQINPAHTLYDVFLYVQLLPYRPIYTTAFQIITVFQTSLILSMPRTFRATCPAHTDLLYLYYKNISNCHVMHIFPLILYLQYFKFWKLLFVYFFILLTRRH